PGAVADRAGLKGDDVLLEYAGVKINEIGDVKTREKGEPVPIRIWREGKILSLKVDPGKLGVAVDGEPAPRAFARRQQMGKMMGGIRGPAPKPLPGTRHEVRALAQLLPQDRVKVLLGSDASEQALDGLASAGKLKDYRILHFATHGRLDVVRPSL